MKNFWTPRFLHPGQQGSAALLTAAMVAVAVGTLGYIASDKNTKAIDLTQRSVRKMRLTEISVNFARDLSNVMCSGLIVVDPASTSISAPDLANTSWTVTGNVIGTEVCYETGAAPAPGAQCGRPVKATAELKRILQFQRQNTQGAAETVREAEFNLNSVMGKDGFKQTLRIELLAGGTSGGDECPYSDRTFIGNHFFFIEAARVHTKGWAKIGNGVYSNDGPINIRADRMTLEREGSYANHNYRFPVSTAEKSVRNFNMTLNGWGYMAELHTPTADPGSCYWRIFPYRRQGIGSGCFIAGTAIGLPGGGTRPVEDLKKGDRVLNPLTNQPTAISYMRAGPEEKPLLEVTTSAGTVVVTRDHAFMTGQKTLKAEDLTAGMVLSGGATVLVVNALPGGGTVYNLALATGDDRESHAVLANGVVTGDLTLQERLASPEPSGAKQVSLWSWLDL